MITFEALRDVAGEEKKAKKPAKLPDGFFSEVRSYLAQKLPPQEREAAQIQLEDILHQRDQKILSLAFFYVRSGVQAINLTAEEKRLFDRIVHVLRDYQRERMELLEGPAEKQMVMAFLQDVPAFVGLDLRTYGPFAAGDIGTLPEGEAGLLIQKGAGRQIAVDRAASI